jgi:hypothetical protein
MNTTNIKTTIAGIIAGGVPILSALIHAYQSGQFTGESGQQVALGCALIVLGYLAPDKPNSNNGGNAAGNSTTNTTIIHTQH